jgi:flagellar protein FlaI
MIKYGTCDLKMMAYYWFLVENGLSILIAGGTASGKTSFLNVLSLFIKPQMKIVSIEDTAELRIPHAHWVPEVARTAISEEGKVDLFELLRESLRQRPELYNSRRSKGKEASVLFQGMASGHPSFATFHAGSVETMVRRFETPPINLPASLVSSLDVVVVVTHIKTPEKSYRRMKEFVEIINVSEEVGKVNSNTLFSWDSVRDKFNFNNKSVLLQKISARTGLKVSELEAEIARRAELLTKMLEKGVLDFRETAKVFNSYYKDKQGTLKQFRI